MPNTQEAKTPVVPSPPFVAWKCPVCRAGRSGFPSNPDYPRYCMNWKIGTRERCAARMEIVCREDVTA